MIPNHFLIKCVDTLSWNSELKRLVDIWGDLNLFATEESDPLTFESGPHFPLQMTKEIPSHSMVYILPGICSCEASDL